ncbi:MAG TPA: polyketide synthase dehydratase domain-containing protein, partial [Thermoanaerobaculia bacterium]
STPEYWVRHIGEPVNFLAGMRAVEARGAHAFLEMGPDATLIRLGRRCVEAKQHLWLEGPIEKSVVDLYAAGFSLSWSGYHAGSERRKVTLPAYAFERKRYWITGSRKRGTASAAQHPLLGGEISTIEQRQSGIREFSAFIGADQPSYLRDHVVMDQVVFPGAGYIEMLLAAQDAVYGETRRPLENVTIHEPLMLAADEVTEVRTRVRQLPEGAAVEIVSVAAGSIERRHVSAAIGTTSAVIDLDIIVDEENGTPRRADDLYADFADRGLSYGPEFQRIVHVTRCGTDVAVSELRGCDTAIGEHLPPAILDCVMQSLAATVSGDADTYLPVRFGTFQLLRKPKGESLRAVVRTSMTPDGLSMDGLLLDGDRPVFLLRGLECRRVANTAVRRLFHEPRWIGRSLVRQNARSDRHLLLVRGPRGFDGRGMRISFAADAEQATPLLQERPTDVVWFWRSESGSMSAERLRSECESNYRDLLQLLRALESDRFGRDQRLWLVTGNATDEPGPASTLQGFGHSLLNEYPSYRVTLLDLPAGGEELLLDECLAAEGDEFQIAYRDGRRCVRRIRAVEPGDARDDNFELAIKEYGQFANVKASPVADVAPQNDEIQVRVHAAGLNFKDVLNALGMLKQYADDAGMEYRPLPLGFECSGMVVAAGPDAEFAIGEEVIVSWVGSMQRRITVPSALAARKPSNISFAEAAGVPAAYITAYYALHHLARIQAGDRVLIHAAAGGVGQAAVQLAQLAGATVFATASPSKWPLLRAQGVEHLSSSRSLDFADDVLRMTDGQGVDIVLNSLNKDFIPAGLRTLATHGRFVELGKLGIWSHDEMHAARPDVAYHNFDLSEFAPEELTRINNEILRTVAEKLADGSLRPLPTTAYSLDEIEEAFGVLSRGQ